MRLTHDLYNAFPIEHEGTRVAIDPGQNLALFRWRSLLPEDEWPSVTHGDPDHHWNTDRVAEASGAHVVCGEGLTREVGGRTLVVDPRGRGLSSWVPIEGLHATAVGESIELDGVRIEAVRAVHGPIEVPLLGLELRAVERIRPGVVIPCHDDVPFLWKRRIAPADDQRFRREVERLGVECAILGRGESLSLERTSGAAAIAG